ncbi:phosphohistidine phosphatase SixA [Gloeobacter kilaueensis]|uniref:Phosphohistidine phosphatase SixA n=1 Tax=Gloeobacter kilaueensis (strain ATCC BAA-2537 / CCAP 1431/1 / ULC 316 / JS1) TaxID=1183438 RepID=U5QII6_GLOK1|nr:phosphohistidine phosphatase SixA [Gloeobacter kilaueensis]AGY57470.1 phosphohistidine phosphatase SixA [Gloeobacter kilaueensis JS1]
MDLLLVRHGIAEEHGTRTNDAERVLTEEGRQKTRRVAKRLRELDVQLEIVLTSPLIRARQTAEILIEEGLASLLELFTPLSPGGALADFRQWLVAHPAVTSAAIVGHQPDLGLWAEALLWGSPRRGLDIKKAGVVRIAIEPTALTGNLLWFIPPRVLL